MLENKWNHGKTHFVLPPLPSILLSSSGIKPLSIILDPDIGAETILLITEPRRQALEFEGRDIASFHLKAGLVNTPYGPVFWLLFYFPDPVTGQSVIYENSVNPKDQSQLANFEQLASQRYWHVVIADDTGKVMNLFEFPNSYGLKDTLAQVQNVCSRMAVKDFVRAKQEYEAAYSIEQLLQL